MKTNRFLSLAIIFAVLMSASSVYAVSPVVIAGAKWVIGKYAANKEYRDKLEEIQPIYDDWLTLLETYVSKTGKVGDCNAIGLKDLSNNRRDSGKFFYECGVKDGNIAFLSVTSKIKIGKCDEKSEFKVEFDLRKNSLEASSFPKKEDCIFFEPSCKTLISGSCPPNMVFVEGGTIYIKGSAVKVNSFCMSKYEFTQKEWQEVTGKNPSKFNSCGSNCPVEQVSWDDVHTFVNALFLKTGMRYYLPYMAEWAYAAKGGCRSNNYYYSGSKNEHEVAWSEPESKKTTHPVGKKKPNELGIYDMSGNVWEYVGDWQGKGDKRIFCGGGWSGFIPGGDPMCSGNNTIQKNDSRRQDVGFRLAHPPISKAQAAAANSSAPASSTFTDSRDNKTYKQVKIGNQTWMAENLNYNATGSRCYGDNTGNDNQNKCATYGRLYNWTTAMNGSTSSSANPSNVQGICPSGWHLPRKSEWTKLTNFVSTDVGEKLKATSGWNKNGNDDGNGTDDYGFSALPGGCYGCEYRENSFGYVGDNGYWWSSDTDGTYASRIMIATNSNYSWGNIKMSVVFLSVRCVQD